MSATAAGGVPLRFQVGARTLFAVRRRLVRVPWSLADALSGSAPPLPPLRPEDHGYLVTSVPEAMLDRVGSRGALVHVRQRYARCFVDLRLGAEAWWAGLSANARSLLGRKARRLRGEVSRHATPDEIAAFLPPARAVAATTYQQRLLGAALPGDAEAAAMAAGDALRGWLLHRDGRPVAFLLCSAQGATLRYDHVGHDPAAGELSPGAVLMAAALRDLFADRFARFDFLEGDGRHKRLFATGGVECCDVLLLRRTLANRILASALAGFDAVVAWAGGSDRLRRWTHALRR
ncbi:GNAT family N-acetyltransferase [Sphingomonas bacterium]|uniref:GNAT family N-acetyltransferase n=1 Tax=Sphingomonas bacterium TaxID=1895847 RepID=UPI0020C6BBB0|nr:GNAT family N-acetyltransferase [Sphingomonas bacterium]